MNTLIEIDSFVIVVNLVIYTFYITTPFKFPALECHRSAQTVELYALVSICIAISGQEPLKLAFC